MRTPTPKARQKRIEEIKEHLYFHDQDHDEDAGQTECGVCEDRRFLLSELSRCEQEHAEEIRKAKDEHFNQGRKQGWQDAGLSLDAQEVLANSPTNNHHTSHV